MKHHTTLLLLTNNRVVWTLSGRGRDFWGSFEIVEGLVCPRTGCAYWVHASSERRVLTTGTFVVHNQKDSSSFRSCSTLTHASWISNQAWCKQVTPDLSLEFVQTPNHDDTKNPPDTKNPQDQSRTTTSTATTITARTTKSGVSTATTEKAIQKNAATTTSRTTTTTRRPRVPAQISVPGTSRVVARNSTTHTTSGTH